MRKTGVTFERPTPSTLTKFPFLQQVSSSRSTVAQPDAAAETEPTSEVSSVASAFSPLENAAHRLKAADNDLRHCDAKILEFKRQHMRVTPYGWAFTLAEGETRDELEPRLMALIRERDAAWERFQWALRSHADTKAWSEKGGSQ